MKESTERLKSTWKRAFQRYKQRMEDATEQYKADVERAWNRQWPSKISTVKRHA